MKLKREDNVIVLTGKDKGKTGKVSRVLPSEAKVIVEGISIIKRHTKPTQANPRGSISEKPAPIASSKVALVCPNCKKPTRVGYEIKNGNKNRVCRKCGKGL